MLASRDYRIISASFFFSHGSNNCSSEDSSSLCKVDLPICQQRKLHIHKCSKISFTLWWFFMAFCWPLMYVYFADTQLEMVFSSLVHIPIALVQSWNLYPRYNHFSLFWIFIVYIHTKAHCWELMKLSVGKVLLMADHKLCVFMTKVMIWDFMCDIMLI